MIASLFAFLAVGCSASAPDFDEFKGTPFTGERPAPDFTLTDQFGKPRSLRTDFDDRVTLLTFLYTECPDVCPIVANHLRDISGILDDGEPDTAIVIVSVDPINDTVESAHTYSERW
ncbi:MAG: SCO family protein, partial [Chloroflexi bacterium]|nr:SCO family protein [Chloroflexota bacterium]